MSAEPPTLSLFQIYALDAVIVATLDGSGVMFDELRSALRETGYRKSAPGFSNAMKRLQKAGLVESRYIQSVVKGYTIREKEFKITGDGINAFNRAVEFLEKKPLKPVRIS